VKLKRYKSPDIDETAAELIQAGGKILQSRFTDLFILCRIRGNFIAMEGLYYCAYLEKDC
jgi:hypothetical protein